MQGGEVVITAPAVSDQTKREFEGKMMTNREILSEINSRGGGVSFANGGDVPAKLKYTGASYNYGGKTMSDHDIYMHINGGHLAEEFSVRDIANIHKVSLATLKKQVKMGMEAESEHTPSKREQMKIVKDHLLENPKYYTLLKKAGLEKGGVISVEKSKWLNQFYITKNKSIDKLLKDLQPKIKELIEKQKNLVILQTTEKLGQPRPMDERDVEFYEAGLIFKMVQAFNKYLKTTDEIYDVNIHKNRGLFEVVGKVKRGDRSYKFETELIDAGGYNIQEYHYRYIIRTDLPNSNENSAVENIKAKIVALKKIKTIEDDIEIKKKRINSGEKELEQGFRLYKIQGIEHKRNLDDVDIRLQQNTIKNYKKEIEKLEIKKLDLISVFESLDKKGVGVNFGKEVKESIGRKILVDRLHGSKYKETGNTLDFKIDNRSIRGAKIDENTYQTLGTVNTFSFINQGDGLCTMKAGLELRGKYTLYAEYKDLPIKKIPYKINEIFNGDFDKYLEYEKGGEMKKEDLAKDADKGDTPARDLNNYNDLMDLQADGNVGGDNGLAFKNGGEINPEIQYDILNPKTHEQFKASLQYAIENNLDAKTVKNIQTDFFMLVVVNNPEDNLAEYYKEIQLLPAVQRDYFQDYINEENLYEGLSKSIYYYLPEELRKEYHVKKVSFLPLPTNENLGKITDLFVSRNELRPSLSGVHFNLEEETIECTNAHIALVIKEKPHLEKSGTFLLGKTKEWYYKSDSSKKENNELDVDYPIIRKVIPTNNEEIITINAEKIYSYLKASKYFRNKHTQEVTISFVNEDGLISNRNFDAGLLSNCIEAMLMLGHKNLDLCFSEARNRALIIVPEGNSRKVSGYAINTDLTLIMPVMRDIYPEKLPIYDLNNQTPTTRIQMSEKNSPEVEEFNIEQEIENEEVEPTNEPIEIEELNEEIEPKKVSEEVLDREKITEAIEALELLSQMSKGKAKKDIQDAIESLKLIRDSESFLEGGNISKNDLSFRPIETPLK
jgi:hypothetical protein